jgi:hypothetical protein
MHVRALLSATACLLALLSTHPVAAQSERARLLRGEVTAQARGARRPPEARRPPAREEVDAPRRDDLSDAVRRVQRRTGGQVVSAERIPYEGRNLHRIKVVDERGRVRVYMDDPSARHSPRRTRGDDD